MKTKYVHPKIDVLVIDNSYLLASSDPRNVQKITINNEYNNKSEQLSKKHNSLFDNDNEEDNDSW